MLLITFLSLSIAVNSHNTILNVVLENNFIVHRNLYVEWSRHSRATATAAAFVTGPPGDREVTLTDLNLENKMSLFSVTYKSIVCKNTVFPQILAVLLKVV